jgi:hypothetical protein
LRLLIVSKSGPQAAAGSIGIWVPHNTLTGTSSQTAFKRGASGKHNGPMGLAAPQRAVDGSARRRIPNSHLLDDSAAAGITLSFCNAPKVSRYAARRYRFLGQNVKRSRLARIEDVSVYGEA